MHHTGNSEPVHGLIQSKAYGQPKRYNCTLAAAFRAYVSDNQTDWETHAPATTLAYKSHVKSSTSMGSFDLVLSRDIPSLIRDALPQ